MIQLYTRAFRYNTLLLNEDSILINYFHLKANIFDIFQYIKPTIHHYNYYNSKTMTTIFLKTLIKHKLQAFRHNLSKNNNPLFIGYYKYIYRPEQHSISSFLNAYSNAYKDNFSVIQIGASDGITHDPIHKFIKQEKWSGVLLEPQPFVHNNFLEPIYSKNKGIKTICAALGVADTNTELYTIGFSNMRWATGLASFKLENVKKAFKSGFVKKECEKYGM